MGMGLLFLVLSAQAGDILPFPVPGVVYGEDDRQDLYEIQDPMLRRLADSTVALFQEEHLEPVTGLEGLWGLHQSFRLTLQALGPKLGLCPEERFHDQLAGAFCSGSLVASDLVLTAGHCVRGPDACKQTRFVFGFSLRLPVTRLTPQRDVAPARNVYSCASIVASGLGGKEPDFALIRLDRPVRGRVPLELDLSSAPIEAGRPLVLIGHPLGLPAKIATGVARAAQADDSGFRAELDAFNNNSGSPVFSARGGRLLGLLTGGEPDFSYDFDRRCRLTLRLPPGAGRGEEVTRMREFAQFIP